MGLAIAIVAVLALGSMGLTGIGVASPAARSSPAAITGTSLTAGPTSGAYAAQTAAGAAGACYQKSIDLPASIASAAASYVTPSGTHAPPLFNAQVQPYAIYTGPYGYVSAGAAMRDQGYGHIQLTWSGTLVAAYMVWSIMANSVPAATATLNNVTLTGTWTAFATPSPCWSPTYIYTFVAAVSGLIVNGGNQLTNFPSGITDGSSPWAAAQTNPMLEGASLVAIYNSSSPSTQQVTLYTGALTTVAGSISAPLNYTPTVSTSARTTFMVADGQLAGNTASWNGAVVDSNAFPGSDPRTSTAVWSYGNLYDTKTYAVNVLAGSNSTTAGINAGGTGDCITWIGQVLSVVVAGQPAPYVVTFQEQGLSSGSNWQVTTAGTTHTAIVSALRPSSIQFSLGNGSYSYTIGAMPGFTTQYSGSYQIAGGSVYILVPFHPITYTINFTETGLPSSPSWWVDLTNTTQGFASNLTVYTTYITFAVPNGTYHFFVGAYNTFYIARPGSGSVVIAGSNVAVPISIPPPPLYRITFSETGLPRGTSWGGSTDTSWGDYTNTTVAPASFSILLPNTTNDVIYPTTVPGYAVPYNILFTVSGAAKTVAVNYQQVFSVYFNTTSLPASVSWEIVVSNANYSFTGTSGTGGLHNITISAPNGTYSFTVYPGSSIYTAHPTTGSVTVSGAKVVVLIAFTHPPFYTLTVVENGLPNGTSWTGYVNTGVGDTDVPTTQSSFTLQLPNTTGSVYGYANAQFNQPSVSLSITGGPTTTYLNFSRYWTVTFPVSGLANETFYLVQIYNASTKVYVGEGEGDSGYGGAYFASIGLLNGKYTVEPVATGYTAVPSAVNMTVAGHGMVFPVAFIPTGTHAVTFNALSLPMGVNWIVVLGTQWQNATWSSMTFGVASGTYSYTVQGSAGYTPSPASGSVTVSATALSVNITFGGRAPTTYAVTFTETGLPGGATWYVNISGQASLSATVGVTGVHAMAAPGAGTLISTSLANGTYSYQVATNEKSWATTATGGFTVNGSPIVVPNFAFRLLTYAVTFAETGLPLSSSWGVTINGSLYSATTPSSVSTTLPNGTYTYAITGFAGFHQTTLSYHGTVTVAGSAVTEPTLVFTPFHWVLTFTESGLPSGTLWYLNVSGQTSTSSTTTTNVIGLANGTYAYTLASSDKRYATNPVSGGFTVAGAPVGLSARYALYTYTVTFNETGLPAGTNWAVTFNGVPSSSTATSILFTSIPNGTYSFTASASGYTATPASGSLSIAKHLGQTVAFAVNLGYAVSFNETGLPA
ncbi:MAG: hypothetical protein ABSA15_05355, partial [Thermoplasmata archaeon]